MSLTYSSPEAKPPGGGFHPRRVVPGLGGGGLGVALLVIVGAALAVKLAGPVVAAVGELFHVLEIVAGVIVGAGAVCVGGLLAWRWRRPRLDAARTKRPLAKAKVVRATPPLPRERQAHQLPATRGRELPSGLHLHLYGVSAEDIAAIIERHRHGG